MTPSALRLFATASGVLLLSLNVGLKQLPSFTDVERAAQQMRQPVLWMGKVAPDLQIPLRGGGEFRLSEHVGKEVVILNFFATWCGPCRKEMPEFNRFAARVGGKPVYLLGIDANETAELVDAFVRELHVSFPVAIDSSREVQRRFGVRSFPTTVLVGADGRIALYETSAILNAEVAFDAVIEKNVAEIAAGRGVKPETWAQQAKDEKYSDVFSRPGPKKDKDEVALTGRAAEIAAKINCICGCTDLLKDCTCATAKAMKKKLAAGEFGDRTNAQIAEDLNREFCMKGM